MSNTIPSPNMNLPVPVPTVDPGPDYAFNEVQCFNRIDSHNHTPGNGVPITPAGLNINSLLNIQGNSISNVGPILLSAQSVTPATSGTLYEKGVDLYFNDGNGNAVRITQSGSVTGSTGTITGLPSGTASAVYQSISGTFQFQSATNTAATMDVGPIVTRNTTVSSNAITITPPTPLSSNYTLTLPGALPTSGSYIKSDISGNLTFVDVNFILPAGVIMQFGGTSVPTGWLFCDGSVVSQTTYANLYSAISTSFNTGGEGAGNFRLPDFRRKVPMGAGGSIPAGAVVTTNTVGSTGGTETVTLDITQIPSHNHGGSTGSSTVGYQQFYNSSPQVGNSYIAFEYLTINSRLTPDPLLTGSIPNSSHSHSISSQGGGLAHSNTQPSLVVNYIIKY